MTNIRGKKVSILRNTTYYIELILMFVVGVIVGTCGIKLYYMIDQIYIDQPLQSLCKNGQLYTQIDPRSQVYVKQSKECENGR